MSLLVWKVDMVRHRLVFAVIFGAAGALTLWLGANDVGDWLVPPETRSVVVDRTFESIRTGVTTIYTDVGKFQSPLFLSFHVEAGPATLTLGHFSGHVLAVDQDP
jgi:hypothetical protein